MLNPAPKSEPRPVSREPVEHPPPLRLLRGVCCLVAGCAIVAVTAVVLVRCSVGFDHEWVESSMARSAVRMMNGRSLYTPPSVEFVGDNYPPLYFLLCGGLMKVFGLSLAVCRMVSVLSTLAVAAAIWMAGAHRSVDGPLRFIWVALFFAFFPACGQVYDLARVDMPATALGVLAVLALVRTGSAPKAAVAGLLMALAILTKQNLVLVALPVAAGLLALQRRRAIAFGVVAFGLPALVLAYLQAASDGWCGFYLFTQPMMHPFGGWNRLFRFVAIDCDLHGILLGLEVAAGACLLLWRNLRNRASAETWLVLLAAVGGVAATLVGRFKTGGFPNNLCIAWAFGLLAVSWMAPCVRARLAGWTPAGGLGFAWVVWIVVAVQLASLSRTWLSMPVRQYREWSSRQQAVGELDRMIARYAEEGAVWVPSHGFLSRPQAAFAHWCPVGFLMDAPGFPAKTLFEEDLARSLERRQFAAIILNGPMHRFASVRCRQVLAKHYVRSELSDAISEHCGMLTGKRTQPRHLFVRRSASGLERAAEQ